MAIIIVESTYFVATMRHRFAHLAAMRVQADTICKARAIRENGARGISRFLELDDLNLMCSDLKPRKHPSTHASTKELSNSMSVQHYEYKCAAL